MIKSNVKQINGQKLLQFYMNLFEGTKTNYGFFGYPHTFSCIQYKEPWLPKPFLDIIDSFPMRMSMGKIQTAQCYKNHPRMEVTRFDHMVFAESIGVDLLAILEDNGFHIDNETKIAFLVFLLTHDIGHGPFSHPFEQMVDGYKGMHEDIGRRAIEEIPEVKNVLENIYPGLTERVVNFKEHDKYGLYALLEGIFDLDRAAFLIMDTYLMDGEDKEKAFDEIVESVYTIFDNIVLKDGKAYIKECAFKAVDDFIRIRYENYKGVYQSSNRVLSDLVLKRLGTSVLQYSKTDEFKERVNKLPFNIAKEILDFVDFIAEMKLKKADIDLEKYYNFEDRNFERIFQFLMLLDNPEISRDCLVMISPNKMNNMYYQVDKDVPEYGSEDFYVDNVVKIYKSTVDENITFIREDGSTIDYKDCAGKFTDNLTYRETLSFTRRAVESLYNEGIVRRNLEEELNQLLIEHEWDIRDLRAREGYPADEDVIDKLNHYVASISDSISFSSHSKVKDMDEYCSLYNISKRTLLCYLLMYGNDRRILEICIMLLSDNLGAYKDLIGDKNLGTEGMLKK